MKRKLLNFAVIFVIIINVFIFNVSGLTLKEYNLDVSFPKSFTVITESTISDNTDFLETLKFDTGKFKEYIIQNNIILFAADTSSGCEMSVKYIATSFTEGVGDLSLLNDDSMDSVADKLFGNANYSISDINGVKYFVQNFTSTDKGGNFSGVQYITVKNGGMYTLSFTFSGNALSDENINTVNQIVNNTNIKTASTGITSKQVSDIVVIIILIIVIIALATAAVYIIVTVVLDLKHKKDQSDVAPYVKIKRRKF